MDLQTQSGTQAVSSKEFGIVLQCIDYDRGVDPTVNRGKIENHPRGRENGGIPADQIHRKIEVILTADDKFDFIAVAKLFEIALLDIVTGHAGVGAFHV